MFINEVITSPVVVDGRRFVERTVNSKFKKGDVTITTTYMDGKPLLKQYILCGQTKIKNVWKDIVHGNRRTECELDNNLNVIG